MDKLGGLQAQFLEIQKAGKAVKGRASMLNTSAMNESRDSGGRHSNGSVTSVEREEELQALQEQVQQLTTDLESEREYVSQVRDAGAG